MKTFKYTVPQLPLTCKEKEGKNKKAIRHIDYILALISFFLLFSLSNALASSIFTDALQSEYSLISLADFFATVFSLYFSFYIPVRFIIIKNMNPEAYNLELRKGVATRRM
jgi:hypothetical protein